MNDLAVSPANQNTNRDVFDAPAKLTGLKAFQWVRAREKSEAKIRAAVFEVTRNINIARDVTKALRQHIYNHRSEGRPGMSDGFFRVVEVVAECGAKVSNQQAWVFLNEVWRAERDAAEAAFGMEPGPGGRKADDPPATEPAVQVRDIRGVTYGSWDQTGCVHWKPAA
jgi:hypothetical protein